MAFDSGSDGMVIFTNNSEDMFNTENDFGLSSEPNFLLNQGTESKTVSTKNNSNLMSGIKLTMPDTQKVDFNPSSQTKQPRERIISNGSDSTIDMEPVKKKKSHSNNNSNNSNKILENDFPSAPPSPVMSDGDVHDLGINFDMDDILNPNKLIKTEITEDNISVISDNDPITQVGSSTYEPPPSPVFNSSQSQSQSQSKSNSGRPVRSNNQRPERRPERPQQTYKEPEQTEYTDYAPEPSKYESENDEKMDLLLKLTSLKTRNGIKLSRDYNMKSSIEDIRMEYRNQTNLINMESSIKNMKTGLITCASGLEWMNRKYDPLGFAISGGAKLDGWGGHVMENIMDFDSCFIRLHEKYNSVVQMEPELEFLYLIMFSAFSFHLQKVMFDTAIPQFSNVLRENPNLVSGIFDTVKEANRRSGNSGGDSGIGGLMSGLMGGMMGGGGGGSNKGGPQPANESGGSGGFGGGSGGVDIASLMSQLGMNGGSANSEFAKSMGQPPPRAQATREMQQPEMTEMYRKMTEHDKADDISVASNDSDIRSVGNAFISPRKGKGTGGNVIKL